MAKSTLFGSCKKKCIAIGKIKITLNGGLGGWGGGNQRSQQLFE